MTNVPLLPGRILASDYRGNRGADCSWTISHLRSGEARGADRHLCMVNLDFSREYDDESCFETPLPLGLALNQV